MKGFKDPQGKFRPTEKKNGIRKSRDQSAKTQGIRLRKSRWDTKRDLEVMEMVGKMKAIAWVNRRNRFAGTKSEAILTAQKSYNDMIHMGIQEEVAQVQLDKDMREINEEYGEMMPRMSRDQDSGEIPPIEIYDNSRLINYNGRYFLVGEYYPNAVGIDEYEKVSNDLFKYKKSIAFTQDQDGTNDLLEVTGGGKKTKYGYELVDEKKFLEGFDSATGLDG